MAGVNDINDLCLAFLAVSTDALAYTAAGAPDRAFVSSGPPAFDCCPQLTVHCGVVNEAEHSAAAISPLDFAQRVNRGGVLLAHVYITIVRCDARPFKQGDNPPSVAEIEAVARQTNQDVWAIWNTVSRELREGGSLHDCAGAYRDPAIQIPAQGGCVGWIVSYRVPTDGWKPPVSG